MILNNYGTINIHNVYTDQVEDKQTLRSSDIPKELTSDDAIKLWTICQEKGWIDENLQPKEINQGKAAIIADAIGARLGLLHRWAWFEELWHIKNLASIFDRAYNRTDSLRPFVYEVELAITRANLQNN